MNICNYDYRIDNNYYGELDDVKIGKSMCEIESIWTDADVEIFATSIPADANIYPIAHLRHQEADYRYLKRFHCF